MYIRPRIIDHFLSVLQWGNENWEAWVAGAVGVAIYLARRFGDSYYTMIKNQSDTNRTLIEQLTKDQSSMRVDVGRLQEQNRSQENEISILRRARHDDLNLINAMSTQNYLLRMTETSMRTICVQALSQLGKSHDEIQQMLPEPVAAMMVPSVKTNTQIFEEANRS